MQVEVSEQSGAFWLRVADWVVFAMRLRNGGFDDAPAGPGNGPHYLPSLDWPPNLFEDEPLLGA
jgi:hypothetical protein